jgi:hypothetical protein
VVFYKLNYALYVRCVESTRRLLSFLGLVAVLSMGLQTFYRIVCMVSYFAMKASSQHVKQQETGCAEMFIISTRTYQYAWMSTVAYLHGSAPIAVVLICMSFSILFVNYFFASVDTASPALARLSDRELDPHLFNYEKCLYRKRIVQQPKST